MIKGDLIIEAIRKGEYSVFNNGVSGLTNLIIYKGNKYVLRKFKSKRESDEIHKIYKKLEKFNFLPKLLHREGNNFVFEYIPGRECKKPPENLDTVRQIARICATVNKLKVNSTNNLDGNFRKYLSILLNKKKINKKQLTLLKEKYFTVKGKIKPPVSLEVWDVHQGNFIVYKKKIYNNSNRIYPSIHNYG